MVSLEFHLSTYNPSDAHYWVDLLKSLATVNEYLNRIAEGHHDEEIMLSAADCIEYEMKEILHRVAGSGIDIPLELNPTVRIEENGATIIMPLKDYINLHGPSSDTSQYN